MYGLGVNWLGMLSAEAALVELLLVTLLWVLAVVFVLANLL
jgi:hypothetical protein